MQIKLDETNKMKNEVASKLVNFNHSKKILFLSFLNKLMSTSVIITFEIFPYLFDAIKLLKEYLFSLKTTTFVYMLILLSNVTCWLHNMWKTSPTTHVYNKPMWLSHGKAKILVSYLTKTIYMLVSHPSHIFFHINLSF